jgi:excisionase family DNA binding protein
MKLDGINFDPSTVPPEQIAATIVRLAAWQVALAARLTNAPTSTGESGGAGPLLTAIQMAERLNVHESAVRTMEREGRIPSVRVGRYVRFRAKDVEAALTRENR